MLAEYSNVVLERTRTLWWNVRAKNGKRRREMVEKPAKKRVRNRTNNRIESREGNRENRPKAKRKILGISFLIRGILHFGNNSPRTSPTDDNVASI